MNDSIAKCEKTINEEIEKHKYAYINNQTKRAALETKSTTNVINSATQIFVVNRSNNWSINDFIFNTYISH
jgi:hypothetical protein